MAADERHGEPARLVDDDDAGVGLLVAQQRRDQPRRGAEREVADDQVALGPSPGQQLGGGPVVADRGHAEHAVDLVGVPARRRRVGELADDRLVILRPREGRARDQRAGVGRAVEDQDDVGLGDVVEGRGLAGGQHAHALVRLAEPLGEDEGAAEVADGGGELDDARALRGEHGHLRVPLRGGDGLVDGLAVRGDHQRVVPGQRDGGEGGGDRADRGADPDLVPGHADASHDAVEAGVAAGDHQRVLVGPQRAEALQRRRQRAEHHLALGAHAQIGEVAPPADDEGGGLREGAGVVGELSEVAVDVDHASDSWVWTAPAPWARRSRWAPASAARYSCRNPG